MGTLKVKINSTVKERLSINYIEDIQGNLKILSDENYNKLKKSILKHGFCFPLFIWENKDDGKIYCLDGNQRIKTLNRMKEEGYSIPQVPVIFLDANDYEDAKEKLAAAASQYGKFTEEGVASFFADMDFDIGAIEIPFLDFSKVIGMDELPPQTVTVSEHERAKSVDLDSYEKFEHKCPRCSHEWND